MNIEIIEGSNLGTQQNMHDDDKVEIVEYERSVVYDKLCEYLHNSNDRHLYLGSNKLLYWQTIVSFDIETTNTKLNGDKVSFMYIWQVAWQDIVIVGRTWEEFIELCVLFEYLLGLDESHRMIIWVHNLAHEFQFIRKLFKWKQVFASDERKVIYAINDMNIEFRCTLFLTNMALAEVSKEVTKMGLSKYGKMVGDLDYSLIRNSKTKMSPEELQYCYNDVIVMNVYLTNFAKGYQMLQDIPYTNTGIVRRHVRNLTIYNENDPIRNKYKQLMKDLTITYDEYDSLRCAFQGGFTHASSLKVADIFEKVYSVDISSSYPSVMITEKFPMSKGKFIQYPTDEQISYLMSTKLCHFVCMVKGLRPKVTFEHILAKSKCLECKKTVVDNGRVVEAESLITYMTNIDFESFNKFYEYDRILIMNLWWYEKDYLPRDLLLAIGGLYHDKTTLKGIKEEEENYILKKKMLNSCYGMIVTDPLRDEILYDSDTDIWKVLTRDKAEQIEKYNNDKSRFLFYPWGVFVTAYARKRLYNMILRMGEDHIYSDTDSDKFINIDKHYKDIEEMNAIQDAALKESCRVNKLPEELFYAKDIKGETHVLGYWDFEGTDKHPYKVFKTLGAKRYLYETDPDKNGNYLHLTFAGWNKKKGGEYLETLEKPFEFFKLPMSVPIEYTGKLAHTYIDETKEFDITDYQGNVDHVIAPSGLHLEPQEFSPGVPIEFERFLKKFLDKSLRTIKD